MDSAAGRTRRRRRLILVAVLGVAFVGLMAFATALALSARSAYDDLTAARADLLAARAALTDTDVATAQESYAAAAASARSAVDETSGALWEVAAAVPALGATAQAVQAVSASLDQALSALAPTVGVIGALEPESLVAPDGTIDLEALEAAEGPLASASEGIEAASLTLASAPSRAAGDWVLPQVDETSTLLAEQLDEVGQDLNGASRTVSIVLPLLGADGPKRYFVGVLNPNEARGTGGFLGTYVILLVESGRITIDKVGSNSDLPTLAELPASLGEQYLRRYGEDPRLVANMNISPHFPAAAQLWLASWKDRTGEELDGAFAADVVALGDLLTATGQSVSLTGGDELTGDELTEFAISGIYKRFPGAEDSTARKALQEQVTADAFEIVKSAPDRTALASAIATALAQRRIQLWSADNELQGQIIDAGVGGTLRVPDGHSVTFAAINSSGSKLDAYLTTSLVYEVGRCAAPGGAMAESRVSVRLASDIPEDEDVPEYMISLAQRGPDGPINSTLAQVHLPLGAEIIDVTLDDQPIGYVPFSEQDRPSLVIPVDLPPRQERTLTVTFAEPQDQGPGMAPPQPLGPQARVSVTDRPCSTPAS